MHDSLISMVREYCNTIQNGRTIEQVKSYLDDEVDELHREVHSTIPGEDGIHGEAINVILCCLDLIFLSTPSMSDEDIIEYARKKCDKWSRKYG
jgi:hypothetical protein